MIFLNERYKIIIQISIEIILFFVIINHNLGLISSKAPIISISLIFLSFWIILNYIFNKYHSTLEYSIKNINKIFNSFFKTFITFNISLLIIYLLKNNFQFFYSIILDNKMILKILLIFYSASILNNLLTIYINKYFFKNRKYWLYIGSKNGIQNFTNNINHLEQKHKIFFLDDLDSSSLSLDKFDGLILQKGYEYDLGIKNNFIKIAKNNEKLLLEEKEWYEKVINTLPSSYLTYSEIRNLKYIYPIQNLIKRIFDILISIFILFLSSPFLIISIILIRLEDNGPIFYSQYRNGINEKPLKILKLRTMINNAEEGGVQWSAKDDYRVTKIGKILRTFRIDELPQLLLVIIGKMSLIGPRPERPEIDEILKKKINFYNVRTKILPGLSGWAQVNYHYANSIDDSKIKHSYDLFYIKNFSIILDLLIFFKTLRTVINKVSFNVQE